MIPPQGNADFAAVKVVIRVRRPPPPDPKRPGAGPSARPARRGHVVPITERAEAKALWDRFEFVYTPKHGSWLNVAEVELSVMIWTQKDSGIAGS